MSASLDWRHYRVGVVDLAVRSDYPEAAADFERLYGAWGQPHPARAPLRIEARRAPRRLTARYAIYGDGQQVFGPRPAREVFPYLEWAINWRIVARYRQFLQIHAATLGYAGRTFVFAADSGSGKSTLAALLLSRGWTYFAEEFALLDPDTLHVHPFPKALCLKSGSFALAQRLGLPLWRRRHYAKDFKGPVAYIDPGGGAWPVARQPASVDFVVFPHYAAGTAPAITPVSRAAAVLELARGTFNPRDFGAELVPRLARLVRGAACYALRSSTPAATALLLEQLVTGCTAAVDEGPRAAAPHPALVVA